MIFVQVLKGRRLGDGVCYCKMKFEGQKYKTDDIEVEMVTPTVQQHIFSTDRAQGWSVELPNADEALDLVRGCLSAPPPGCLSASLTQCTRSK